MAFCHILWRDRNCGFHSKEPLIIDNEILCDFNFTFIDIVPGLVKQPSSGLSSRRESFEYHNFGILIDTANEWLNKNQEWEVINCETVLLFFKFVENGWQLAPQDVCFPLDGDSHSCLMCLRLWLKRKQEEEEKRSNQQLSYIDFKPKKDEEDDNNRFERLESLIKQVNIWLSEARIRGKLITIETLYIPANTEWNIDPELTLHFFPSKCVSILRIFYQPGIPVDKEIGIKDFVPKLNASGGFFRKPSFEPLSKCISRASDWLSDNSNIDFKNAQCIEIKIKSRSHIETNILSHSVDHGDYLRIFRVAYTKRRAKNFENISLTPLVCFTSIIFTPADKETTIQSIKVKLDEWIERASFEVRGNKEYISKRCLKVLSAETVKIFSKDFSEEALRTETENTYQYNRVGTKNRFFFTAFRLYFDIGVWGRRFESKSITSSVGGKKKSMNCEII